MKGGDFGTMPEKKKIVVYIPPDLHRRLKQMALDTNSNVSAIVEKSAEKAVIEHETENK